MKRVFKLTESWLHNHRACSDGLNWFVDEFQSGATLTNDQQEMFELCEKIGEFESSNYLSWLCKEFRIACGIVGYFGIGPCGSSYGSQKYIDQDELSSHEPEHCALVICQFVDKFGKVTKKL